MSTLKKGQAVTASTSRGASRSGTYVATHTKATGEWAEIKPTDGGKNFKARPSRVRPA